MPQQLTLGDHHRPAATANRGAAALGGCGVWALLVVGLWFWSMPRLVAQREELDSRPPPTPPARDADVPVILGRLRSSYGLTVDLSGAVHNEPGSPWQLRASPPDPAAVRAALPLIEEEWALYPPAARQGIGVKRLVLTGRLADGPEAIAGTVSFAAGELYLTVGLDEPQSFVRAKLHHELYHAIDSLDDGIVQGDGEWQARNPAGFEYWTTNDPRSRDPAQTQRQHPPGFTTGYGQVNDAEDKADCFEVLMTRPQHLAAWCAGDPVLRAKIVLLKRRLAAQPWAMGDAFWAEVERRRAERPLYDERGYAYP